MYAIAVGHPFNDANKRTALAVGDLILLMNGQQVIRSEYQIELADRIVELAAGKIGEVRFMNGYVEMLKRRAGEPESGAR